MVDAQFTNVRVLKPFEGFERVYQGQPLSTPIAFPGERDPRAQQGKPGFDPNLMIGIPVPEGARVVIWFPVIPPPPSNLNAQKAYSYKLIWRFKNLGDYRDPAAKRRRAPFHFPRQSPGAPDTSFGGIPLPRTTIPAGWHVIAYEQPEPAQSAGNLVIRVEKITPKIDSLFEYAQPLLSNGAQGVLQQGVVDPASLGALAPAARMPLFLPFWTDAEGDELIILVNRETQPQSPPNTWDFVTPDEDFEFSNIYGTGNGTHEPFRDVGIYLQTGTAP
jgi:hypothetical protein